VTGFSLANAKDGGGSVLTLGPGDVPSGRVMWGRNGGSGKDENDMATGFRIWDAADHRTRR